MVYPFVEIQESLQRLVTVLHAAEIAGSGIKAKADEVGSNHRIHLHAHERWKGGEHVGGHLHARCGTILFGAGGAAKDDISFGQTREMRINDGAGLRTDKFAFWRSSPESLKMSSRAAATLLANNAGTAIVQSSM